MHTRLTLGIAATAAVALTPIALTPTAALAATHDSHTVLQLQRRLTALHYYPGPVDGRLSQATKAAVAAFRSINGLPAGFAAGARVWHRLAHPRHYRPLVPHGPANRVEISLRRQVLAVLKHGRPVLITHISTGSGQRYCSAGHCAIARTHPGNFHVFRTINGWHRAVLGEMYRPMYFDGPIAMHGSLSVPLHRASHGCVRLTLDTADRVFGLVRKGMAVDVR